jgi:hypothetical protein
VTVVSAPRTDRIARSIASADSSATDAATTTTTDDGRREQHLPELRGRGEAIKRISLVWGVQDLRRP